MTMNMNQQLTSKTSPKSQYPIVFAADGDSISAYLNNNGSRTTTLNFKDNYNNISTRPTITSFGGRYLTAACDRTGTKKTYFTQSTTALGSGTSNGSSASSVPALKYCIGGTDDNHYMKGTMHSLRFYNRFLTDAEIVQNNAVDEVRFRGNGVIVCTQHDGVEGVEACGFYTVDSSHEFSAPAERDVDGTTWQCIGYTLDTYNSSTDAWSSDGIDHLDARQYSYNASTGGRVRLTWLWTKKRTGYAWTGAAGDGKFSTLANWADLTDGTAVTVLPTSGQTLSFSAAAGGTITNDLETLGGADIVFPVTAGQYTITGNCFTNVANVINESASVQTLSNAVFFVDAYNVAIERAVNFAGGAIATTAGTTTGAAGGTLTGEITFTGNWAMNASYTVPSGSRLAAQKVTGSGAALKLTSSSGDNATITMGTGSTLTGNVSLGTNTTVTAGANAKITGNVSVGTNSTVTLGVGAQIAKTLTMNDGATLELAVNADSSMPVSTIKLASGNATIKLTGDYSSCANMFTIKKKLGLLDPETNAANFTLDATGVTFPPRGTYSTSLRTIEEDGLVYLMFRAAKNTLRIYIR